MQPGQNRARRRNAIILVALCTLNTWAIGQNDLKLTAESALAQAPGNCPPAQSMKAAQLHGMWGARFMNPPEGLPVTATLLLEQHAEFSESLAGSVSRDLGAYSGSPKVAGHAAKAELAGDLEQGILMLDESSDSLSITGAWNGELVADSCGQVIRGTWKDTSRSAPADAPDVPFVLRRLP